MMVSVEYDQQCTIIQTNVGLYTWSVSRSPKQNNITQQNISKFRLQWDSRKGNQNIGFCIEGIVFQNSIR